MHGDAIGSPDRPTHGAVWGLGHSLTLLIFAGAAVFLDLRFGENLAWALECIVGVMLILLGGHVLVRLWCARFHFHRHRHADGRTHFHVHSHLGEGTAHDPDHHVHAHASGLPVRTLLVGMVHGLAGSAALVILTASTVQDPVIGLLYVALFGLGSIAHAGAVFGAGRAPGLDGAGFHQGSSQPAGCRGGCNDGARHAVAGGGRRRFMKRLFSIHFASNNTLFSTNIAPF